MKRLSVLLLLVFLPLSALAQTRWVQIEAPPSLLEAEARARDHARTLSDVQAFSIGSGWYAIAMGPYTEQLAQETLDLLLSAGAIPRDSFLSTGSNYRQKIWPSNLSNDVTLLPSPEPTSDTSNVSNDTKPESEPISEPEVIAADETPREARETEAALNIEEKKQLQVMLKWAGFYNSTIDGAFGRGTRASMADWQAANNFEVTGVLTTLQRGVLFDQYKAILADLGLQKIHNQMAGIAIDLPMARVKFENTAAPLVHYTSTTGGAEHVFLISQSGDRDDLAALFEVLQTLAILPRDAVAKFVGDRFEISGPISGAETFVTAELRDGEIKGYAVVWPNQDRELTDRFFARLADSFERRSGTLSTAQAAAIDTDLNLVFGLEIRRPLMMRSGVYISNSGNILTAAEGLDMCKSFIVEGDIEARLVEPNVSGLAILQPVNDIAPPAAAKLATSASTIGQNMFLTSYPYGGRLNAPTITGGSVEDLRGLDNDGSKMRLSMPANSNDIGGAVFDEFGHLHGILVSPNASGRLLPSDTQVAIQLNKIIDQGASLALNKANTTQEPLREEALVTALSAPAALIECWEN